MQAQIANNRQIEDKNFPSWPLWTIALAIFLYQPVASISGHYIGYSVGMIARYLNSIFNIIVDIQIVVFVAAILGSTIPFIFSMILIYYILYRSSYSWQDIWISYQVRLSTLIWTCTIGLVLAISAFSIVKAFGSTPKLILQLGTGYWRDMLFSLINYLIIAVVFEEITCRGIFYQALRKHFSLFFSVLASALFFAFIHAFYNTDLIHLSIVLVFGIVAALLFHYSRSLTNTLILHSIYNATLFLLWL